VCRKKIGITGKDSCGEFSSTVENQTDLSGGEAYVRTPWNFEFLNY
jgi:hypothetical protein